ncbi:MAG: insulinase family protein, partial [Chloroflexi bacterium]|nr:insulinase family protein [Chloroflexota bacterium]
MIKATYKKTVLPNGMKVITEKLPIFRSVSIGVWVNVGTRCEKVSQNGYSHFLEHMTFKGTKSRSAREIAEIFDSVGGQLNAFTEKEQTCYYARVVDKYLPLSIEIIADMLQNSLFDPEDIEKERGVVLEEIKMYEDSPEEMVFDLFNQVLMNSHPLGMPIIGTKNVVEKLNRKALLEYMNDYYTADNIIICAAG